MVEGCSESQTTGKRDVSRPRSVSTNPVGSDWVRLKRLLRCLVPCPRLRSRLYLRKSCYSGELRRAVAIALWEVWA